MRRTSYCTSAAGGSKTPEPMVLVIDLVVCIILISCETVDSFLLVRSRYERPFLTKENAPSTKFCQRSPPPLVSSMTLLSVFSSSSTSDTNTVMVAGLECIPVTLELPIVGSITVLEATAKSQDDLVNLALQQSEDEDEDEDDTTNNHENDHSSVSMRLHKGDIYGNVLWPASFAVSSYLLEHNLIHNQRILEVGTGTGLVSLASYFGGAQHVLATDYEQLPLILLRHAADHYNNHHNHRHPDDDPTINPTLQSTINTLQTRLWDVCEDEPIPHGPFHVMVAADLLYEPRTGRAIAHRVVEALRLGCRVIIGDSPGRAGRPEFLRELSKLGVHDATFQTKQGYTITRERHELICGTNSNTRSSTLRELDIAILDLCPSDLSS